MSDAMTRHNATPIQKDSPIEQTQLTGGPLLLSHAMPETHTVALGIFLNIGSRDEPDAQAGIAHALEHMLFKGTKRHDVDALAEALDRLGGAANAFTGRERTCFHIRVLREDWPEALGILCDMVLTPTLPEEEWLRERDVIYSEMAMAEDVPEDWVFDRHVEALYPGQSVGRPVLGRRDSLAAISRNTLHEFISSAYRPPNMLVAAAGCIRHEELAEFLAARDWPEAGRACERHPVRMASGAQHLERDDEQAYFVISLPGVTAASEDRPAAWLANQMLGGGMSSRLFREVREKRGLAYGVASHLSGLSNTGAWTVSGSAEPEKLEACLQVVGEVLQSFPDTIRADEFGRARRQLEVSLRMSMDSVEANMLHLGNRFDEANVLPQDAWVDAIHRLTMEDVAGFSAKYLTADALWTCSAPAAILGSLNHPSSA